MPTLKHLLRHMATLPKVGDLFFLSTSLPNSGEVETQIVAIALLKETEEKCLVVFENDMDGQLLRIPYEYIVEFKKYDEDPYDFRLDSSHRDLLKA